jgi:pimeloyl-ACP methyl ester carboxylesterase
MTMAKNNEEKRQGKAFRIWRNTLLTVLLMLIIGFSYEQIGRLSDYKEYPPIGKMIDINGHDMHIWADGTGNVTVVFAVGYQTPSAYVDFYPLSSEISKHTRVAVYERPGYGWSDAAKTPRDIDTITLEIHELLVKSGEQPPYILVGHSIGSLETLRFAQLYKDEVKGVILLDGSNPEMYKNMEKPPAFAYARVSIFKNAVFLSNKIGLTRLLFQTAYKYSSTPMSTARNGMSLAPDKLKGLDEAMFLRTFNNRNQVDEGKNKEENAYTVLSNGYLGNTPLVIFTSEYLNSYEEGRQNQLNLLKWSSNSKQIFIDGAGHAIHWSNPEEINNEILGIVNEH